ASKPTSSKPAVGKTAANKPVVAKAAEAKPPVAKAAESKPVVNKAVSKPVAAKPVASKPVVNKPMVSKPALSKIADKRAAAPAPKKAVARKNVSDGNGREFVEGLAQRLDEHRREILHLYRHDLDVGLDAFRDGDDEIDRANFDSDRDLALSLSDSEREVLLQIEEALGRIASGEFGSCTSCSKPIGEQRLHAIPWARYCIDCQELEEKGLLG
ncbi:MAG TPA: TraR/DksA C4-type zinc finger protein, partial [Thermoanaerobaculia bacterium]|nr:TraR/DksA C4-type zinc finger protein [Thermoanaerobaculia bacterium]